jgi:hypothetical protein
MKKIRKMILWSSAFGRRQKQGSHIFFPEAARHKPGAGAAWVRFPQAAVTKPNFHRKNSDILARYTGGGKHKQVPLRF